MKAYSFYFNPSDWLGSPAVKMMSKAERGTYIDLLSIAWNSEQPGTLPASEEKVRRLSELSREEWAESGEVLLEKFPLSACGTYRYNPRLLLEVEKQRELSEKNAENGRKSAERRAAAKAAEEAERQRKANENSTTVAPQPTTVEFEANESSTKPSQAKQSTIVDRQDAGESVSPSPLTSQPGGQKLRQHDDAPLFDPAAWPGLNDPARFAAICKQLGYEQVNTEIYRHQILAKLESKQLPASSLRNFIESYLNNHNRDNKLVLARAPIPNEVPSNAQKGAITGSTIPPMSSMLNPNWKQHTG